MQTEKATQLCTFLMGTIDFFGKVLAQQESNVPDYLMIKDSMTELTFQLHYQEFEKELEGNILEYKDINVIHEYVKSTLLPFSDWGGFAHDLNNRIIKSGYEVNFLLKLKLLVEAKQTQIRDLVGGDSLLGYTTLFPSDSLKSRIRSVISKQYESQRKAKQPAENKPQKEERFDFDVLMDECKKATNETLGRITFIQDRLYDFRQWQLKYDKEDSLKITFSKYESKYQYTSEYYPKFEILCNTELERLNKKLELEKKALTHKAIKENPTVIHYNEPSPFTWTASDTDLLELVAALHKNNSIKRKDGKPLTRKELVDFFQQIFNIEIKDVEGKLNKATSRKKNMTPFLDSLKGAFESYAEEKEEKLQGRR